MKRFAACASALGLAAAVVGPATAEQILGLTTTNALITFDSATPGAITTHGVTGLGAGEVLTGIDVRPANNQLYTLSTIGNLYRLQDNGATYGAILVNNIGMTFANDSLGFDFNPVPDRLRIVSAFTDANLRVNPDTGAVIVDTPINPGDLFLAGLAYSNNFAGATSTTLYGIDSVTDQLMQSTNPNGGSYVPVGPLGIDLLSSSLGFDISGATGVGYFNSEFNFYQVNLTTGAATLIGSIGTGQSLRGLTVLPGAAVPEPATWAAMITGFTGVGAVLRARRRAALLRV